jgi:hypothetical protein
MYHFVRSGGPIPASHLSVLLEHFERVGLPCEVHDEDLTPDDLVSGDAYLSCDMSFGDRLAASRAQSFHVQLAHNLTGLKGSPFDASRADLNILPGRLVLERYRIDATDPRYVVAGYPKWDSIYRERFAQAERRRALALAHGLDLGLPWVVFYPTGPNAAYATTAGRAVEIYARLRRDLGPIEYLLCDHAHNEAHPAARAAVDEVRALGRRDRHVRVVDGHRTLPWLTACDLFVTDVASSLLTVLSMDKPVLFVPIVAIERCREATSAFQCGDFLDDVGDVRAWLGATRTAEPLRALFARAVAYDDDQNCARIARLIVERYEAWCAGRTS